MKGVIHITWTEWTTTYIAIGIITLVMILCPLSVMLLGLMLFTSGYMLYLYLFSKYTIPKLYFKDSPLNQYLQKHCNCLHRAYQPTFWSVNAHVQTFLASLVWIWRTPSVQFEREYLQMTDKGIVALDWCVHSKSKGKRNNSHILLIFPGISGDAYNTIHIINAAKQYGFRCVVINNRGHGDSFLATNQLHSFGDPQDVRQCLLYITQKFPKSTIAAVAIGTGSAALFSYLGEYGSSCRIRTAAFISPIYDISKETIHTIPKCYQNLLLLGLKKILIKHGKTLSKLIDMQAALSTWDLLEYQSTVYCKLYDNLSIDQFLERNDPMRDVDDIAIPVLCINSLDDPVFKKENIPYDIFNFYPNMLLLETEYGGHCGFWENAKLDSWATDVVLNYITSVLNFIEK